jgi:hypothetical protein
VAYWAILKKASRVLATVMDFISKNYATYAFPLRTVENVMTIES